MAEKVLTHESFMRFDKTRGVFEYKVNEHLPVATIRESDLGKVVAMMKIGPQGENMAKIFEALVDAARKDPSGEWVSASDQPLKEGQAVL
jgi:hypothetical protein